jgi:hypothetical protein
LQKFSLIQRFIIRDYSILLIHFLQRVPQTWPIASEVLQTFPDWILLNDGCDGRETAVNKGTPKS